MTIDDEHGMTESLTAREVDILRCVAEGLTNRQIAEKLYLSPETVKWYNKQLFRKLGVSTRTEAAAHARTRELLHDEREMTAVVPDGERADLPAELSSFVGRRQEMAGIAALLEQARLVTLTGPGGVGKTRLALHVAATAAERYPHGVHFVSLAGTVDPALVHKTIATRLGLIEQPGHDLTGTLRRYLRNKQVLLVLDNYEHVLAAAPLVTDLLTAAPALTILATSREALRLTGEHEYLVPPLTVPATAAS